MSLSSDLWQSLDVEWDRYQLPVSPPRFFDAISGNGLVSCGWHDYDRRSQLVEVHCWDGSEDPIRLKGPGAWSYQDRHGTTWFTPDDNRATSPSAFAWAPKANYLITGSGAHEWALRLFDVLRKEYMHCFGSHAGDLYNVTWSAQGSYAASASSYPRHELKLWEGRWAHSCTDPFAHPDQLAFLATADLDPDSDRLYTLVPVGEVNRTYDSLPWWQHDWLRMSHFYGFGELSFSPDERWLAVEIMQRDFRNRVAVYRLPHFDDCHSFQLPADVRVSDIAWHHHGLHLFVATHEHKVYGVGPITDVHAPKVEELPLRAERLCMNPTLPVLAVASGKGGRDPARLTEQSLSPTHAVTLVALPTLATLAELKGCTRVIDLAWSREGQELFVLTSAGQTLRARLEGRTDVGR